MKDFDLISPKTREEAVTLLDKHGEDCRVIAGGQSLLNILKQGLIAPRLLVNIKDISDLNFIRYDEADGLTIGAVTTHRTIELSPVVLQRFKSLVEMERGLAAVQIRNWGTIGGNLCIADPTGDPAPLLIAMNAEVTIASSRGERTLPVEDLFVDYYETILQPQELLIHIRIPPGSDRTGLACAKFRIVEGDQPIVTTAVSVTLDENGGCVEARIAMGGVASTPVRARQAESMLEKQALDETLIREAAKAASEDMAPIPDVTTSETYKERVAQVLVRRLIHETWAQVR
jgi:carbon-monoxide dehydrogenase medium subunit